jgi:magnesium chelatase family protein
MAEFTRGTIEALRQPLEDRTITIARAKDTITFPAKFILVGTTNPCPCGYYGTTKSCSCSAHAIASYMRKLSGPILDRVDLYVSVEDIDHTRLLDNGSSRTHKVLQRAIASAHAAQRKRFESTKLNSEMTNNDIKRLGKLQSNAKTLLDQAAHKLGLSARAYIRTIKVARTIADLDDAEYIEVPHISEALRYRRQTSAAGIT